MANHTFSDLKGKVCVITGGAGIIGTAIVKALAAAGVKTVILDLRKAVAEELADAYQQGIWYRLCRYGEQCARYGQP